jgi:hypothetical protein
MSYSVTAECHMRLNCTSSATASTGVDKITFTVVSAPNSVYSCIVIYLFIYYCIIYLFYLSSSSSFVSLLMIYLL